ncbi:DMT family transporter [Streptococcus salivarius]|uniref:DMT family transporter n=1 Tax=Streptococcus salivarius TaxID=1304 RepID=UPI001BDAC713|nr:multidrug resistance efflux transporter family protein [Streptococcus salivarius]MBT0912450.1 multidrug resistance efflux transporter family protein [Streptococcus salivarius]
MKQSQFARALWYGILGALFFAFTFIFNRSMNLSGGSWMWSASLRYLFSLPMLAVLVWRKGELTGVLSAIKKSPLTWLIWSTVGFGLFYGPLSLASIYGESWFVAATWQITILAGLLLTPLFGQRVPGKQLLMTLVILLGIILIQIPYFGSGLGSGVVRASLLILLAAFAYPLGNRKMMVHCKQDQLSTTQRVFGMTLMSMPFWLLLSVFAGVGAGLPSGGQILQSLIVAVFSGVVATLLFFEATNLVKHNHKQLAVVEATQAGEVLFTLLGGCLFLGDRLPSLLGFFGIAIVTIGIIGNSLLTGSD